MSNNQHTRLVIPGPVEVRREILEAQTGWMIGHRSTEFAQLFARLQTNLRLAFLTQNRVFVAASSGTGLWEAAARNCIRDGSKVLHLVNGAFSERWAEVSKANGKQVNVLSVRAGQAIMPGMVANALKIDEYDAVCVVHNETSTGVINPIQAISVVVRQQPDTLLLVDAVSSFLGAELQVDKWGIDFALTSSQKAFGLPPGLAFAAVSNRALSRARQIQYRGYYFDFLVMADHMEKNHTPSTPPITLMYAADRQLDDVLAEGLENRWERHIHMRDRTIEWAQGRGFGLFAQEEHRSPTVTAITTRHLFDVNEMADFMLKKGFLVDKGYGKLKGETFRIAHMGDMQPEMLEEVLTGLDEFFDTR